MAEMVCLVERCRAGDASAWEEIVRLHSGRVYNLCYRFSGRAEDAQDLTQEVFIKAYRHLDRFDAGRAALGTWLASIARNAALDHYRRTKPDRRTDSLDAEPEDRPDPIEDAGPSPFESLARRERQQLVQRALSGLRPEFREVVILRDLQDMDYAEIAAAVGVPEGTVKSRLSRGRAELARLLARIQEQVGVQ
jgi:RNA polymerase sigma factor (sigma-70 family)